jgi:hypothetical protein
MNILILFIILNGNKMNGIKDSSIGFLNNKSLLNISSSEVITLFVLSIICVVLVV